MSGLANGFAGRLRLGSVFNRAAYAGPRRFLVIGGGVAAVAAAIAYVSMSGASPPLASQTARLPTVNSLPGGVQSDRQQEKLALLTNQEQADQAARGGRSYTPPMAAGEPAHPASAATPPPAMSPAAATPPRAAASTTPKLATQPIRYRPNPMVHPVAETAATDQKEQETYNTAVDRLLRGWDGRTSRTEVTLPAPASGEGLGGTQGQPGSDVGAVRGASPASRLGDNGNGGGRLLMPAGRGVFAHTVLASSSDSEGPVVLQADSGPLAGDRMLATFSKANSNGSGSSDRLVVRVNSIEHRGQTIGADGIVIAPDTMETTVASSVDEHYLARFALPAAAAFVQGLGQALATTSNTVGVLSPLGGTSYATQLKLPQQLGVGAGVAAQQLGNTLNQQAPRGSTVHLDANANVGVMFLAPVTEPRLQ